MQPAAAAPNVAYPDADAIIAACHTAVTEAYRDRTLLTQSADEAVAPDGVRVRFTTGRARYTAVVVLKSLGYAACSDSCGKDDEALLVTGWNTAALTKRLDCVEPAATELRARLDLAAVRALTLYRDYVHHCDSTPADARSQVVTELRETPGKRVSQVALFQGRLDVTSPIADADRRAAPEHARTLLERIAAADATLEKLANIYAGTARGVIALYDQNRIQHRHTEAAVAAVHAAAEASAACLALATLDLDFLDAATASPPGQDPKAAFQAELLAGEGAPDRPLEEHLTAMRITNQGSLDQYDICRHCRLQLHFLGRYEPDPWRDAFGEQTCTSGRKHQPFPGAYEPDPDGGA